MAYKQFKFGPVIWSGLSLQAEAEYRRRLEEGLSGDYTFTWHSSTKTNGGHVKKKYPKETHEIFTSPAGQIADLKKQVNHWIAEVNKTRAAAQAKIDSAKRDDRILKMRPAADALLRLIEEYKSARMNWRYLDKESWADDFLPRADAAVAAFLDAFDKPEGQ